MDALPRDVALDAGVSLRVDRAVEPRVIVGQPDGGVVEMSIVPGESRWIDVFHVPGEYRIEVVDQDRVELLFSVYADRAPPPPSPLPGAARVPDLFDAERTLYAELTALRARNGLPPLPVYGAFEPIARAHATCLASTGEVAHTTPWCPGPRHGRRHLHAPRPPPRGCRRRGHRRRSVGTPAGLASPPPMLTNSGFTA